MSDQHIDREVLGRLQEVMGSEYAQLLRVFLADCEERMVQLREARTPRQLTEAAHSFKGSCSNMGANDLADLCRQLEVRVMHSPVQGIEDLIAQVEREYLTVRLRYDAELQSVLPEKASHQV